MTDRMMTFINRYAIPLFLAAMALGAAQLELRQKEDRSDHAIDVARLEAHEAREVQRLETRDEANAALLLDVLCAVKPRDRRCK